MKKLLTILMLLAFTSCIKDDECLCDSKLLAETKVYRDQCGGGSSESCAMYVQMFIEYPKVVTDENMMKCYPYTHNFPLNP